MLTLKVNAAKSYSVTIAGDLSAAKSVCSPLFKGEKIGVVADDITAKLYFEKVKAVFDGKKAFLYTIKHGEKSKNIKNYNKILNKLAKDGFTREDGIVTLGGGVAGDLGAFVASTYMRGITLAAFPTSLLSMVDSSIGGKTAVDLKAGKNLCGTFYQPSAVYVNLEFLKTLPEKEIRNGLGEIIKYTYISPEFKKKYSGGKIADITEQLIYDCLKIKADIVEKDELESGERKLLNFGHTFGHAIEKVSGYKLPHGICVVKGIKYALILSKKFYNKDGEELKEFLKEAKSLGINPDCEYETDKLLEAIKSDKKRKGDEISFITSDKTGTARIENLSVSKLGEYVK